jgi:hypothetical protein
MAQCWAKGCLDYARQQIDGSLFWKRENECLYTCMHMCVCVCVYVGGQTDAGGFEHTLNAQGCLIHLVLPQCWGMGVMQGVG